LESSSGAPEALRAGGSRLRRVLGEIVFRGHRLADLGDARRDLVLEFLQLGTRLGRLAGLRGITLVELRPAAFGHVSDALALGVRQQVLQLLIRERGNPLVRPVHHDIMLLCEEIPAQAHCRERRMRS